MELSKKDFEEKIIAALLIDNELYSLLADIDPDKFSDANNKMIFEAEINLLDRREPLDLLTLAEILESREQLDMVGGFERLVCIIKTEMPEQQGK